MKTLGGQLDEVIQEIVLRLEVMHKDLVQLKTQMGAMQMSRANQMIRAMPEPPAEKPAGTLLDDHGVADILNVSVATVRRWRLAHEGPRYYKVGNRVRYKREWLDQFLKDSLIEPKGVSG